MLAAFEDIRLRPNSMTVLAFPDHVLATYAQPSPNPVQLQMTTPFPMTLPACQLPADYKQRHGLHAVNKHLAHRAPFSQQLAEYKAWCTNPIQLDRPGRVHSSCTWLNSEKHIFLYLEHCHQYHQVSEPTMQLFLSTPLICHYVSFHIAAKHTHLTIRNFLVCAKRVLRWWQTKPGGKHSSLVEGLQWLQTLNEQVLLLLFCVSSLSGCLLQSWCTSLTQHGNMLSWTCSSKVSPRRPADSCTMQPWVA